MLLLPPFLAFKRYFVNSMVEEENVNLSTINRRSTLLCFTRFDIIRYNLKIFYNLKIQIITS